MRIKNERVFVLCSSLVFILINTIENYIHYNIGRNHEMVRNELAVPNLEDVLYMGATMIVFAILQSMGTYYLYNNN